MFFGDSAALPHGPMVLRSGSFPALSSLPFGLHFGVNAGVLLACLPSFCLFRFPYRHRWLGQSDHSGWGALSRHGWLGLGLVGCIATLAYFAHTRRPASAFAAIILYWSAHFAHSIATRTM